MKNFLSIVLVLFTLIACNISSTQSGTIPSVADYESIGKTDTLFNFNKDFEGESPTGFISASTGKPKSLKWIIVRENVEKVAAQLATNAGNCYNLLIKDKVAFSDFIMSARIKAVSGTEDQGGGLIWRCIDNNNYYVARYNPLEANFRFYKVVNGIRSQMESVDVEGIGQNEWFQMGIEMRDKKIICLLNGKKLIETSDQTFSSAGLIGLWTKADAVTYFDDLKIEPK